MQDPHSNQTYFGLCSVSFKYPFEHEQMIFGIQEVHVWPTISLFMILKDIKNKNSFSIFTFKDSSPLVCLCFTKEIPDAHLDH